MVCILIKETHSHNLVSRDPTWDWVKHYPTAQCWTTCPGRWWAGWSSCRRSRRPCHPRHGSTYLPSASTTVSLWFWKKNIASIRQSFRILHTARFILFYHARINLSRIFLPHLRGWGKPARWCWRSWACRFCCEDSLPQHGHTCAVCIQEKRRTTVSWCGVARPWAAAQRGPWRCWCPPVEHPDQQGSGDEKTGDFRRVRRAH